MEKAVPDLAVEVVPDGPFIIRNRADQKIFYWGYTDRRMVEQVADNIRGNWPRHLASYDQWGNKPQDIFDGYFDI